MECNSPTSGSGSSELTRLPSLRRGSGSLRLAIDRRQLVASQRRGNAISRCCAVGRLVNPGNGPETAGLGGGAPFLLYCGGSGHGKPAKPPHPEGIREIPRNQGSELSHAMIVPPGDGSGHGT